MASLQLEIVTPDKVVLSQSVNYTGLPGIEGEFGVLAGHIPFLSALAIGKIVYRVDNKEHLIFISGGFAEVSDNKITVLAESAEVSESIDFIRAEKALKRAQDRLAVKDEAINQARAELALKRAMGRLSLRV